MDINKIILQGFLQDLMLSPRYRIARHVLLISTLMIISLNQTFVYFQREFNELGGYFYVMAGFYVFTYLVTGYLHIYYLLPKFLFNKKYGKFVIYFLSSILLIAVLQSFLEYYIKIDVGADIELFDFPWLIGFFANCSLIILCFAGIHLTILLKHWITDNQRISILEQEHLRSQVEQLKEQVSPVLLFNTLNCTGVLAETEPEKASTMLLKLSQLLRYQLYDCNREKVLLTSEITFITNYLKLEQLCTGRITYELTSEGEINRILVPPLLFIPFVQLMVHKMYSYGDVAHIQLHFKVAAAEVIFICEANVKLKIGEEDLNGIYQRLDLLYPNNYRIILESEKVEFRLKIKK